ncbi:MAG: dihydrodipicolinate synthase family protein [Chloroflexota bacterium]
MPALFTALLTPFTSNGEVDVAAIPPHLRWLEARGADGIVPCGTTGEGLSLSFTERQAVIDTVLQHRGKLRVIAGTGCVALPETIALTQYALERGAEAALVIPPFFFKNVADDGLVTSYRQLCEALPENGKIVLYHIPPISQIPITTGVIDRLLESYPHHIYGIKDSGGDATHTAALIQRYPHLHIFDGAASVFAQTLADGAAGGIFALANIFPEAMAAIITAHARGESTEVAQTHVAAIERSFRPHVPIEALKALFPRITNLPGISVRAPLVNLTEDENNALWKRIHPLLDPQ